jgi:hypothetical protein
MVKTILRITEGGMIKSIGYGVDFVPKKLQHIQLTGERFIDNVHDIFVLSKKEPSYDEIVEMFANESYSKGTEDWTYAHDGLLEEIEKGEVEVGVYTVWAEEL